MSIRDLYDTHRDSPEVFAGLISKMVVRAATDAFLDPEFTLSRAVAHVSTAYGDGLNWTTQKRGLILTLTQRMIANDETEHLLRLATLAGRALGRAKESLLQHAFVNAADGCRYQNIEDVLNAPAGECVPMPSQLRYMENWALRVDRRVSNDMPDGAAMQFKFSERGAAAWVLPEPSPHDVPEITLKPERD